MPRKPTRGKKGDPLLGAVIDRRWLVLDQIGSGGMGVVYRAERVHLGKQVALKFLHASVIESKSAVARFEREAKAVSRLHHVNCVSILDFGVYRKQPYIVMEYIEGRQLNSLDPETITPSKAVLIMRQVLMGLAHAHARGVIHRDLKLSNVMVVEMTGTDSLVKLLDFGLARLTGGAEPEVSLTTEGMVAGTPTYMSPEQAQGKPVDHRTDIYSAGVMLYTLATGRRPFQADATAALLHKQVHETPTPPRRAAPQKRISEALDRVILRAMEKSPDDRFQDATEFLRALDDTPEGQATQTPTVVRHKQPRRRWLGIAALVCVALGATGALWLRAHLQTIRNRALEVINWKHAPDAGIELPPPARVHARPVDAAVPRAVPSAQKLDAAAALEKVAAPEPRPAASEPKAVAEEPPPEKAATVLPAAPELHPRRLDGGELVSAAEVKPVIEQLRNQLVKDHGDAHAHVKLGNIYVQLHWRRDAFKEWDAAFDLSPGLKTDRGFRKVVCESAGTTDRALAQDFFSRQFGPEGTAALLMPCVRAARDALQVDNTVALIEAVSGAGKVDRGQASLHKLELARTCAQKKQAIEELRKLRYARARPALTRIEREQKQHPSAQTACLGNAIADALAELKDQ